MKKPAKAPIKAPAPTPAYDGERAAKRTQLTGSDANPARPSERIVVHTHRVACDGVGGALGHPRVYIELGTDGLGECGYCDRLFVLAGSAKGKESERLAPGVYEGPGGH